MNQRLMGAGMMVVGIVLVAVGVVGYARGGAEPEQVVAATSSTTVPPAVTSSTPSTAAPSTEAVSSTVAAPTTSLAPTTTSSTTTSTTTTTTPAETVEGFVEAFASALAAGDVEFVWARLHPEVIEDGGEALCRSWVESEIMALSDYRLLEVTAGPETVANIPDVYTAAVTFVFQGQAFDDGIGQYALVDGEFFWLGTCR